MTKVRGRGNRDWDKGRGWRVAWVVEGDLRRSFFGSWPRGNNAVTDLKQTNKQTNILPNWGLFGIIKQICHGSVGILMEMSPRGRMVYLRAWNICIIEPPRGLHIKERLVHVKRPLSAENTARWFVSRMHVHARKEVVLAPQYNGERYPWAQFDRVLLKIQNATELL